MLDAHSDMWGMGEDSVFAGHLNNFLPSLIDAMESDLERHGSLTNTTRVVADFGEFVLKEMSDICSYTTGKRNSFIVDKHLGNFVNIGR